MATQQTQLDNETQIKNLLEARSEAMNAFDAEKTISFYGPDTLQFLLPPPLAIKSDAETGKKAVQGWFDTFGEDGKLEHSLSDIKVYASDDIAFVHCLGHMGGVKRGSEKGDENLDLWYRNTIGLQKIDGEWKIVHDHESVPFYMDGSDKAALDLKPE